MTFTCFFGILGACDDRRDPHMFLAFLRFPALHKPLAVAIRPRFRGQIHHSTVRQAITCLGLLCVRLGWAQAPHITSAGVVNAGSYAQPISPGSIVSIFGTNLASTTATARGTPLPPVLVGTSVTLNGINAPLFFVSPGQINLQVPWSLQSSLDPSGSFYRSAIVVVTTRSGSSAPLQAPLYQSGPAIFSLDLSGCGRAAALNVAPDGGVSLNSPSNSAAPGDYVSIYGTGFGLVYFPPPDGTPATGPQPLIQGGGVVIDGQPLISDAYDGLAPTLVGVNQTNFQIPVGTREGCAVPVAIGGPLSPSLSISIHSGRGQCVDPPIQSYGQVSLTKTVASGTANAGETDTLTAVFPSAPGLKPPPAPAPSGPFINNYSDVLVSRSCPVAGYANLSAAISSASGPVTFHAGLEVDSPIQIQTPLPPGTVIPTRWPLTVKWTGGIPGYLVKLTLISGPGLNRSFNYAYVDAASSSFTFDPLCFPEQPTGSPSCSLGPIPSNDAQVIVEVSPGFPISVAAQGITGRAQVSWTYRYIFGGLVLSD